MKALVTSTFGEKELKRLKRRATVYRDGWVVTDRRTPSEELAEMVGDKEILIVELDEVGKEVFRDCKNLRVVGCCRGNPVNIDIEAANYFGIPVINTPGRNAIAVAELTISMMVNLARNMSASYASLKKGKWNIGKEIPFTYYKGIELNDKTVGLVGFGDIGRKIATRLKAFGMNILVYDPYLTSDIFEKYGVKSVALDELLRESRFVSIHCKVTEGTKGLIGEKEFNLMRKDAYFINTSRAIITKKKALINALKNNLIAGAALDVFHEEPVSTEDPVLKLDNVFITPHIGGATYDVEEHHARIVLDGIFKLFDGEQPYNLYNPQVLDVRRGDIK